MLLLIDNYDSFVYNLARYLEELGREVSVIRNDALSVDEIRDLAPEAIIISPGPCTPNEAGISLELIERLGAEFPILGVCLGHQTLGQVFGGRVVRCDEIVHGKLGAMHHNNTGVFAGLPSPFDATRYHSLVVDKDSLPPELEANAWLENGTVMGLRHRELPMHGVQFHPESIASEHGHQLLRNFLQDLKVPA